MISELPRILAAFLVIRKQHFFSTANHFWCSAVVLAKRLVDDDFVLINWLWEIVFLCVKGRAACFKKSLPFKLAHIR